MIWIRDGNSGLGRRCQRAVPVRRCVVTASFGSIKGIHNVAWRNFGESGEFQRKMQVKRKESDMKAIKRREIMNAKL